MMPEMMMSSEQRLWTKPMKALILTVFILGSFSNAYGNEQVYEMICQDHNELLGGYLEDAFVVRQPKPGNHVQYTDLFTFIFGGVFKSPQLDLHIYRFKTKDSINFNEPEKMATRLMKTVNEDTPIAKGTAQRKSGDVYFAGAVEGEKGLNEFYTDLTRVKEDSLSSYNAPKTRSSLRCSDPYLVNYEPKNNLDTTVFDSEEDSSSETASALD